MRHKPKKSARLAYWKREAKLNAIFYASESAQVTELLNIVENLESELDALRSEQKPAEYKYDPAGPTYGGDTLRGLK